MSIPRLSPRQTNTRAYLWHNRQWQWFGSGEGLRCSCQEVAVWALLMPAFHKESCVVWLSWHCGRWGAA